MLFESVLRDLCVNDPARPAPSARSTLLRAVCAFLCALVLLAPPLRAAGRLVSLRANDGRAITGLMMEANQRPAPAVVLVPMLGRPRDDWAFAAQRLADAGITALAIDLPGQSLPASAAALAAWHADIGAAVVYLMARPEVRPTAVGVAGASLGANLAVVAASMDPRIRSLALVS